MGTFMLALRLPARDDDRRMALQHHNAATLSPAKTSSASWPAKAEEWQAGKRLGVLCWLKARF
jgi:hypothetical protein